jgi:hypothetical protein
VLRSHLQKKIKIVCGPTRHRAAAHRPCPTPSNIFWFLVSASGWLAIAGLRCAISVLLMFLLELEMAFPFVHLRGLEKTHMLAS